LPLTMKTVCEKTVAFLKE